MPPILGVINATTEWIFAFDGRLSVTISNADRLMDVPRAMLAQTIWQEVSRATGIAGELPPWQIVRERRATFAATPEENAKRPATRTRWRNLVLAGDWTATGLPATLGGRGAVRQSRGRGGHHRGRRMTVDRQSLDTSIAAATQALLACQRPDGEWCFELEADATIPSEYVLLRHYLAEPVDAALEEKIAVYLRRTQSAVHGGWALFQDGDFDISASVKAYFALKMIGDSVDAPHMARARHEIRARGGAGRANIFTKIMLALFGFVSWRAVPAMPAEIMLFPKWFPFHLDKISYWSRTVIVPLLVLMHLKPVARNPKNVRIDELFLEPPATLGPAPKAPQQNAALFWFFRAMDEGLRLIEPILRRWKRQQAIDRAVAWTVERLNGEDGLGGIYPAMANSVMMFAALGYRGGLSAAGDGAARHREASGAARRLCLLPALRVADLGHRARRPCAAGDRRCRGDGAGEARPAMAGAPAGARRQG